MSPILTITLATAAVAAASATIIISGQRAYREISVPLAASGLAMIYEEAAEIYRVKEGAALPSGPHQKIARALEVFDTGKVLPENYIADAASALKRRSAFILATREDPGPGLQIGPIISLDDPWGTPYTFTVNSDGTLSAVSAGPDKIPDTGDDVTSAAARKRQKLPHPSGKSLGG